MSRAEDRGRDQLRWEQQQAWRFLCAGHPLTATLLGPLVEEIISGDDLVDEAGVPRSRMIVAERQAAAVEQAIALGREAVS